MFINMGKFDQKYLSFVKLMHGEISFSSTSADQIIYGVRDVDEVGFHATNIPLDYLLGDAQISCPQHPGEMGFSA